MNHLWHPVSANVERLQPLQARHAGPRGDAVQLIREFAEILADFLDQRFGLATATGFFADPQNVAPNIAEILRIQTQNLRPVGKSCERRSQILRGSRADVAQVLRDDQVRRQFLERFGVHGIQALAASHLFTHKFVDLEGLGVRGNTGLDNHAFGARLGGIVAFVAHAHNVALEA